MHRYPDAYLDHWADVYISRHVRRHNITLLFFLADPKGVLKRVDRIEAAERASLEPPQHRRDRRAQNSLRQRGEQLVQKLWHGSRRRNRADAPLPSRR